MKKKKWMIPVMLLVLVVFAACDRRESANSGGMVPVMAAGEMREFLPETEAVEADAAESKKAEAEMLVKEEIVIYYSNQKADGLETETVEVEKITPEAVINSLARHHIVSIDTKVNGFEIIEESGRDILTLDLSKAFAGYLKTMGSSGETVVIAALTNTFLDAYQADAMVLTVNGNILETGHAVYDGELIFYDTM